MGPSDSGARGESVWADLRARRSQVGVTAAQNTGPAQEATPPTSVIAREPVRSFEPGTIGRLVEDEVAATLGMAEDLAGWAGAKAIDAIRNAEFSVNQVQRSMKGLAQELHDIAESMSRGMPPADPKKESPFDAGPWDLVEIPPSQELPDYDRIK
jgi:hypothetical protein